jgi:hypothetical protein
MTSSAIAAGLADLAEAAYVDFGTIPTGTVLSGDALKEKLGSK